MPRSGRTPTAKEVAGVIDRQGRIDIIARRTVVTPLLLVKNTNYGLVERLTRLGGWESFKMKLPDHMTMSDADKRTYGRWAWRCQNDEAVRIVKMISPWLKNDRKQQQAYLVLSLKTNEYGERRLDLGNNADITAAMEQLHWQNPNRGSTK